MIRSLISEIKEFKKPSILASLFMVFEVMFEISIPFVMASLLDQGVQQRNMNNILFYGGLMLVCAFLSLFCGMQSAVMAPMLQLVLPKTFVGPFSKRFKLSRLKILTSFHLEVWSLG